MKRFYEVEDDFKNNGIKQKSAKVLLKSSMMQEIAYEEGKRVRKKIKTNVATSSNDERSQAWKEFLNNAQNNKHLPSLSPEKHGVIWYGVDLRRRLSLPEDLYTRTRYETTAINQYNIGDSCKEAIKNIIQSTNCNYMLESIEVLRSTECNAVEKKALIDLFMLFGEEIYDDIGDTLSESEACLSSNLLKPCLQVCSRMLRNKKYDITYMPGEIELTSMTEQLSKQGLTDNRFKYYADGKVRINADKQKLLLLEVSSAQGQAT
ncbi:unnamed protein product [Mucor fragilis]